MGRRVKCSAASCEVNANARRRVRRRDPSLRSAFGHRAVSPPPTHRRRQPTAAAEPARPPRRALLCEPRELLARALRSAVSVASTRSSRLGSRRTALSGCCGSDVVSTPDGRVPALGVDGLALCPKRPRSKGGVPAPGVRCRPARSRRSTVWLGLAGARVDGTPSESPSRRAPRIVRRRLVGEALPAADC